jgi:cysteine synthase
MLRTRLRAATNVAHEMPKKPEIRRFLDSSAPIDRLFDLELGLSSNRVGLYKKLYFGIGNSPCYKVNLPNDNRLYIKMEYANASGNTHYSRFWIPYLFVAEALGVVRPNVTKIIEVSSGSSGIALANACKSLELDATIIVPKTLPPKRIAPMRNERVTLVEVDGYIDACLPVLTRLLNEGEFFATNHSEEKANIITAVFSRIALEFVAEYGVPDIAFLGIGNGTTIEAINRVFKAGLPSCRMVGYMPDLQHHPEEVVIGLIAANLEDKLRHVPSSKKLLDEIVFTTDAGLNRVKSTFAYDTEISNMGPSSLYGIELALRLAESNHGLRMFSIGYDKSDRY